VIFQAISITYQRYPQGVLKSVKKNCARTTYICHDTSNLPVCTHDWSVV